MNEWDEVEIGEYCEILSSKRIFARDYVEEGIPFYRSKEIIEKAHGKFSGDELFITPERFNKIKEKFGAPEKGDLLISAVGNRSGIPYCVKEEYDFYFKDGNLIWFRNFSDELSSEFLEHFLNSKVGQGKLESMMIGSAQKALTISGIKKININLPPLPEQKAIAHILGKLDDKIELNRKMNETLEGMAQALFKSWFVDFDPVLDNALVAGNPIPEVLQSKAERRKAMLARYSAHDAESPDQNPGTPLMFANPELAQQFPDRFTFNETLNKWIPEGWGVETFGDVSRCFDRKRIPLSKKQREEKKPGHYPYYGATSINDYINEYIFDDTYLLLGEDGSVIREDGTPFTQYVWGKIWVNNHAHVLQGDAGISTEHLMTFIRNQNMNPYITGAVQLKINQKNMNSIPFLYAQEEINLEFSQYLERIYERYKSNVEQIETLTKLRDTLLPQLISGKVRLPEEFVREFGG